MRISFRHLSYISILFSIFLNSCKNQEANEHYLNASNFFKHENYEKAILEIGKATSLDKSNSDYKILNAKILNANEKFEEAINIILPLLKDGNKLDTLNYLIGIFYYSKGYYLNKKDPTDINKVSSYKLAHKYLDISLKINNLYIDAYEAKVKTLHNMENYKDALLTSNKALKLFPDNPKLIYLRGIEKYSLGDNVSALKDLDYSINSKKLDSSQLCNALRFKADVIHEKFSVNEALPIINLAILADPKNYYGYMVRAEYHKEKGNKDLACKDYRNAADLGLISVYEIIKEYCGN
ncbi:NrfG FOG, TPR repeat [Spirosomataceae bacterium]